MVKIASVDIAGIHDKRDVHLPFRNGHCILIGPNGTGKSTALQIIANSIGRRWEKIAEQPFHEVRINFTNGSTSSLLREDCLKVWPAKKKNASLNLLGLDSFWKTPESNALRGLDLAKYSFAKSKTIFDLVPDFSNDQQVIDLKESLDRIRQFETGLETLDRSLNIFLPTYRRIELELARIIDDIPESAKRALQQKRTVDASDDLLIEIIRFGMDDVAHRIERFETQTRNFARNQFNGMMSSYLKDMASGKNRSVRELRSTPLNEDKINVALSRIEEGILNASEKASIVNTVLDVTSGKTKGSPSFQKMWLSHFFIKLFQVNDDLERIEKPITSFINSINKYISPKKMKYDAESYHVAILDENGNEILLGDLSSGEKQIISILSEAYFQERPFNILIDEPELSLSVPWQATFLEDIAEAPSCRQIIAVTHSPFIYDNRFSSSVVEFGYG